MDNELFRCQICGQIPENPNHYNPFLCTNCGQRVCHKCQGRHQHEKSAEELFREKYQPQKPEPVVRRYQSTTGTVDENDVPF